MDFRPAPEEQSFRQEVRGFLKQELPPDWEGADPYGADAEGSSIADLGRRITKKLVERKWIALAWPKQYGGMEATHMQQMIFNEEMAYHAVPSGGGMGVAWVGPSIMLYGTEQQKQRFLPRITSGEDVWCTLYSEPGAGSDLASLQTRAVQDGDDFVISGQKIWTSQAHYADWMFLLARTDPEAPKHKGISYFLLDMKSPGITVRPLINMAYQQGFSEVFFDNVRVPRSGLLGELNRGWYMATTTLDFERSSVAGSASGRRTLEELTAFAKETKVDGGLLFERPQVRHKLAELWIELGIARLLSYRVVSLQERGLVPNYESSIVKVTNSLYSQRLARTGLHLLGLYGQLQPDSPHARLRGRFERSYLATVGSSIAGGTNEIQRNIIAQ